MSFAKTLSRDEMKQVKAGRAEWYSCTCYSGSHGDDATELGSVTCSSGMEQQTCCQAQYENTTATTCSSRAVA